MMVPGAVVEQFIADLLPHLEPGDILIDGGNSYYVDDIRRAKELAAQQIHYIDCGTSGGVMGLERGYCLMIGGPEEAVQRLDPVFKTLAPGVGDIARTPGREKLDGTAEQGYLHCGPSGGQVGLTQSVSHLFTRRLHSVSQSPVFRRCAMGTLAARFGTVQLGAWVGRIRL